MTIGIYFLLFAAMGAAAVIGSVLLFLIRQEKANDVILVLMTAYSLVIALISATALPYNYTFRQAVCWIIGLTAVAGAGIYLGTKKKAVWGQAVVAVSVLAGMANLFLF